MQILGITFVGTRTQERDRMGSFLRDVLGLAPQDAAGMDAEVFSLPDGSSFAVTSPDGPADTHRTVGFLVTDILSAARELHGAGIEMDAEVSSSDTQRYLHFRAPDGHLYELVEQMGSVPINSASSSSVTVGLPGIHTSAVSAPAKATAAATRTVTSMA
jgi:catechol 2,3-dioxygenase-like lactoylglutathione lyase family enzyme